MKFLEAIIFYSPVEAPCVTLILVMLLKNRPSYQRHFSLLSNQVLWSSSSFGDGSFGGFSQTDSENDVGIQRRSKALNMIKQGATAKDANITLNKDGVSIFP